MTVYHETPAGLLYPPSRNGNGHAFNEHAFVADIYSIAESAYIAGLQDHERTDAWGRLGDSGKEFNRETIGLIADKARAAYLKNPLINRAVEVGALYVWGQDLTHKADDLGVQAVVDRFWAENQSTLTGQQASRLLDVELTVTGNVFLALFSDRVTGLVRVRTVPMEEIVQIVANPDDRYDPWYYRRTWEERSVETGVTQQRDALYPDWRYAARTRRLPRTIRLDGRDIDVTSDTPICHVKVGAFLHWRWGVSEVYAALDWAKAYKELLEDDATRSRALARFAFKLTTGGGAASVAAAKTKFGTTFGSDAGTGAETNPPPVAGSMFLRASGGVNGQDLDPIRIAGATLPSDHSHPVRLMVAAATGLDDVLLSGDVDQGNLATRSSMNRPTELRYSERRAVWRDLLSELIQWVIDRDLETSGGLLRGQVPTEEARQVTLSWPSLLERSKVEEVDAVVKAVTLGSVGSPAGTVTRETTARLLLTVLGVEDVDAELEALGEEWTAMDARREEMARLAAQRPQPPPNPNEPPAPERETTA